MVKFYINGIEVNSPVNWEELRLKIARDREVDTLLLTADTTFEWTGSAAKYLNDLIEQLGFCDYIEVLITDENINLYEGTIFLSSCEIDEEKGTIKAKVEDRSFYKSISVNKSVKAIPSSGKSKNGIAITPAERYLITLHDVDTGADDKEVYGVRVYEAFMYLIRYMSNNELSFASDTFAAGGEWEGLAITSGLKLRGTYNEDALETGYKWPTPPLPAFSFVDLYTEIKKKSPIGITIEGTTVRIESLDYFYTNSTTVVDFENIEKIITKFDQEKLYSAVNVGSTITEPALSFPFPESQNGVGYKEEQFASDITCNLDRTLDLVSNWVISSNVIQDCVENNARSYDDELFLIDTDYVNANSGTSTRTDSFFMGKYFYNDRLRNINVLLRYNKGVPASLLQYNGTYDPKFEAQSTALFSEERTVTGSGTTPSYIDTTGDLDGTNVIFDSEISDPNNVYSDTVNFPPNRYNVFTAPSDGLYGFEMFLDYDAILSQSGSPTSVNPVYSFSLSGFGGAEVIDAGVRIRVYDNAGTLVSSTTQSLYSIKYSRQWSNVVPSGIGGFQPPVIYGGGTTVAPYYFTAYMLSGYRVAVSPISGFGAFAATASGANFGTLSLELQVLLKQGSYFKCFSSSLEDLNLPVTDINQYIARSHSFTVPLSRSDFDLLKNSSRDMVEFSMYGQLSRKGWIQEVNYSYVKGEADIKLISNNSL